MIKHFLASLVAFAIAVVLIASCATTGDKFIKVEPGMTPAQVTEILGAPKDRNFKENVDQWTYEQEESEDGSIHTKILDFKDGKLAEMRNGPTIKKPAKNKKDKN